MLSPLDVQFRLTRLPQRRLQLLVSKRRTNPFPKELVDLLRGTPNERLGVEECIELVLDGVEVGVLLHPFDQIVVQAELLDLVSSLVRQHLVEMVSRLLHETLGKTMEQKSRGFSRLPIPM